LSRFFPIALRSVEMTSMQLPRFTTGQLLLAMMFVSLVLGLFTYAWRDRGMKQVERLCFSPSGRRLAVKFYNGDVHVWSLEGNRVRHVAQAYGRQFTNRASPVVFDGEDRLVSVSSSSGARARPPFVVRSLNIRTGQIAELLQLTGPSPYGEFGDALAVHENRLVFCEWTPAGVVCHCYDLANSNLQTSFAFPTKGVRSFAISQNGAVVGVIDELSRLHLFETETGSLIKSLKSYASDSVVFSVDGSLVAVPAINAQEGRAMPGVTVASTRGDYEETIVPGEPMRGSSWIKFSSDGRRIATGDWNAIVCFDVKTGAVVGQIDPTELFPHNSAHSIASQGLVRRIAFSPDGCTFAVVDGEAVRLWDLPTNKMLCRFGDSYHRESIAIFVVGFAVWAGMWGVARKRNQRKESEELVVHAGSTESGTCEIIAPNEVRICWAFLVGGGTLALLIPISAVILFGPIMLYVPMVYYSLLTGIAAISRGASRDTMHLRRAAVLQLGNIIACDPINPVLAAMELLLLQSRSARVYLGTENSRL
jgi:hypothetical protein